MKTRRRPSGCRPLRFQPLEPREMLSLQSALATALNGISAAEAITLRDWTPIQYSWPSQPPVASPAVGGSRDLSVGVYDPFQLGIRGNGYFIIEGPGGDLLYTRNDGFKLNTNDELVTLDDRRVLGHRVNENHELDSSRLSPLGVPIGAVAVQPTQTATFAGVLSPTADVGTNPSLILSDILGDSAVAFDPQVDAMPSATAGTLLTNLIRRDGDNLIHPFERGLLTFIGRKGDRTLAPKQMAIDADTTVQNLITFMDEAFGIDNSIGSQYAAKAGGLITPHGQIQFTGNIGIENRLTVGLSAFSLLPTGADAARVVALPFFETEMDINGRGSTTDFIVFDSLGMPLTVRITTVIEDRTSETRTWRWFATSADNEPLAGVDTVLGNGRITFDNTGRIGGGGTATIAVERNLTGAQLPLEFTLDFSQVDGRAISNNPGQSVSALGVTRQDGFPPGALEKFIVNESGLITGVFDNGLGRSLGQIVLAGFRNPRALRHIGSGLYVETVASGLPRIGQPGQGGLGSLHVLAGQFGAGQPPTQIPPPIGRPPAWRPPDRGRFTPTLVPSSRSPYDHVLYQAQANTSPIGEDAQRSLATKLRKLEDAKPTPVLWAAVDVVYDDLAIATRQPLHFGWALP